MKEHFSRPFREGDASRGHSSVEDSVAALDLVKWFVLNKKTKPALVPVSSSGGGGSAVAALV